MSNREERFWLGRILTVRNRAVAQVGGGEFGISRLLEAGRKRFDMRFEVCFRTGDLAHWGVLLAFLPEVHAKRVSLERRGTLPLSCHQ